MPVLLTESDEQLAHAMCDGLERHGLEVEWALTVTDLLHRAGDHRYAIILLGSVPSIAPADLCVSLREIRGDASIIALLDGVEEPVTERVAVLNSGADDCLSWPVSCQELAARIRAIRRRVPALARPLLSCGELTLDVYSHRAWRAGTPIDLSRTEFTLLRTLMSDAGMVLPHRFLVEQVWGYGPPRSNLLQVYVGYLREKIDRPFGAHSLHTIRGVGYRLSCEHRG